MSENIDDLIVRLEELSLINYPDRLWSKKFKISVKEQWQNLGITRLKARISSIEKRMANE